ncbi:11674_t:CDS:2, partial [Funneliformis mosseae]
MFLDKEAKGEGLELVKLDFCREKAEGDLDRPYARPSLLSSHIQRNRTISGILEESSEHSPSAILHKDNSEETKIERHPPDKTLVKSQPEAEFHRHDQYEAELEDTTTDTSEYITEEDENINS